MRRDGPQARLPVRRRASRGSGGSGRSVCAVGKSCDSRAVVERTCRRWALRHHLDPEKVLQIAHGRRTRDTVRVAAPHLETDREAAWLDAAELADVDGLSP